MDGVPHERIHPLTETATIPRRAPPSQVAPGKPYVELRGVAKTYRTRDGEVESLRPLTFDIGEGEFLAVVGPSGCGKSTLLKLIAGLLPATQGRITLNKFVELTSTNPAKANGLHPRKGTIAVGADADLVIWQEGQRTIRNADLHHAVDYTPYEGIEVQAWPAYTLSRGEVVWDGEFHPRAGRGEFLRRGRPTLLPKK